MDNLCGVCSSPQKQGCASNSAIRSVRFNLVFMVAPHKENREHQSVTAVTRQQINATRKHSERSRRMRTRRNFARVAQHSTHSSTRRCAERSGCSASDFFCRTTSITNQPAISTLTTLEYKMPPLINIRLHKPPALALECVHKTCEAVAAGHVKRKVAEIIGHH